MHVTRCLWIVSVLYRPYMYYFTTLSIHSVGLFVYFVI